jgi:hypothetical protein
MKDVLVSYAPWQRETCGLIQKRTTIGDPLQTSTLPNSEALMEWQCTYVEFSIGSLPWPSIPSGREDGAVVPLTHPVPLFTMLAGGARALVDTSRLATAATPTCDLSTPLLARQGSVGLHVTSASCKSGQR